MRYKPRTHPVHQVVCRMRSIIRRCRRFHSLVPVPTRVGLVVVALLLTAATVRLLILAPSGASALPSCTITGPYTVCTDKPNYSPGETVTVTGSGFVANAFYDVPIVRPNGTIVKGDGSFTIGWDTVQADGSGDFTYYYQLNGIVGTYTIKVFDTPWGGESSGEVPLATHLFEDDTGFPTSIASTYNPATGVLTVSGTWAWTGCPVAGKAAGFAIFINGANPVSPGSGALDGSSAPNTMHPVNMTNYVFPCASSGTWGPDTHTLATAPTTVCVVIYDVHDNQLPPDTGNHSTVGAGTGRNADNSYQVSTPSGKPSNSYSSDACGAPTILTATFNVAKNFSPDHPSSPDPDVTMAVTCTSGTVSATDATANEQAVDTANFTVSGFSPGHDLHRHRANDSGGIHQGRVRLRGDSDYGWWHLFLHDHE